MFLFPTSTKSTELLTLWKIVDPQLAELGTLAMIELSPLHPRVLKLESDEWMYTEWWFTISIKFEVQEFV